MTETLSDLRSTIRKLGRLDEGEALSRLIARAAPDEETRAKATRDAAALVRALRADKRPGLMEVFLAEYGLSTREGIALMCLAEALLRVPDAPTMDALIEDKIAPSAWSEHLGHSSSPLVNASTWALMLTGSVLREDGEDGIAATLKGAIRRLGEPVIRAAAARAMREMGTHFVLGEDIGDATRRAAKMEARGYTYSYDMLGEAALTAADAAHFLDAYEGAIAAIAPLCKSDDIRENSGISIKLSALHPRYETLQRHRLPELVERVTGLALAAREAGMGLNIDAEEAERLDISLDVIEAVLRDPRLQGWDGFGVVVQGYGTRAPAVIDWLYRLAETHDRKIMLRLVKGAYWDREIKRAQVEGLERFPVWSRKPATDAAYLCCAKLLLDRTDRIYPQFATHNAHTVAAILAMAGNRKDSFEFQRLHGMGETLHDMLRVEHGTRCRIYAPVGAHRDLLAYLVRRLLENGANSSFVNQLLDPETPPEELARCPFAALETAGPPRIALPADLFAPERRNSRGWDIQEPADLADLDAARAPHASARWTAAPTGLPGSTTRQIVNPADPGDVVGEVREADTAEADTAIGRATPWDAPVETRAEALNRAADLYETHHGEFLELLAREAGKTLADAAAELREAVDFLRYYAAQASHLTHPARGIVTAISPWNFPLAIFTGQLSAALAAGNAVIAKPAETTPLVAARATAILHEAGVPETALQLLPGEGRSVGAALASDPRVAGVVFTGSTATAQAINRAMADHLDPGAPLIAETGGLNAMVVDSTALPEQAVRDIVNSAFRSAGQRCSALRMLYLQEDIAGPFLEMLEGAMDELVIGDPRRPETDVGPVISAEAREGILAHIAAAEAEGRLRKRLPVPGTGHFVPPVIIDLPGGIDALEREVFGPVLHVATYKARDLSRVVEAVNARGYGLTFGMHSRIDDRVETVAGRLRVGNIYVNRNQIGAVVGSQPFGGEGLSGTGPKAGGPHYLPRFTAPETGEAGQDTGGRPVPADRLAAALAQLSEGMSHAALSVEDMPGPTGESNRLSVHPRGSVLCLGPGAEAARAQAERVRAAGGVALAVAPGIDTAGDGTTLDGSVSSEALTDLAPLAAVVHWGGGAEARAIRKALAARSGPIVPLVTAADPGPWALVERHLCVDTTAAGGNAALLAEAS